MITVLHYATNKDPDIYFNLDQNAENKIVNGLKKEGCKVERCSDEEWPGQSNPGYSVHHWTVKRGR